MEKNHVSLDYSPEFTGTLHTACGDTAVGRGGLMPYEMLLAALGSCYYATFLDVTRKMKLSFDRAHFEIDSVKRDEVPTVLKEVSMRFEIYGAKKEDEKKFLRAAKLAGEYCSIHVTLEKVCEIKTEVSFVE